MLYRNLLAMETEELLRSYPADGAVLMGGCDKTTPGAAHGRDQHEPAGDLPARRPDAARRLARPTRSAAGSDVWKYWAELRAGTSPRTTGTRSRTASRARRALHDDGHGVDDDARRRSARLDAARARRRFRPPTRATRRWPPRPDAASSTWSGTTSSRRDILTPARVRQRDHDRARARRIDERGRPPVAMARRAGIQLDARSTSTRSRAAFRVLANIRPAGQVPDGGFLLRGRPARPARRHRRPARSRRCTTVNGKSLGENIAGAKVLNADVIRTLRDSLVAAAGWSVLARQPRARRRGDEAHRRRGRACCSTQDAPSFSTATTT